jgi:hypothetical protein
VARSGRDLAYVAGRDAASNRVERQVFSGFAAQVRACFDLGGAGAVLHCRLEWTDVEAPARQAETGSGAIHLPVLGLTRLDTSLWAPLDRTVVIGGGAVGGQGCLFLATVRALHPGK